MFKVKNMTEAVLTIAAMSPSIQPLVIAPLGQIEVSETDISSTFSDSLGVMSSAGMILVSPSDIKKEVAPVVVEEKKDVEVVSADAKSSPEIEEKLTHIKAKIKALEVEYRGSSDSARKQEIKKLILALKKDIKALK